MTITDFISHKYFLYLARKAQAYRMTFLGDENFGGKRVLLDLAKFCHADTDCKTEREAGRREVWLYIRKFLQLRDEELAAMYARLTPEQRLQIFNPSATFLEE